MKRGGLEGTVAAVCGSFSRGSVYGAEMNRMSMFMVAQLPMKLTWYMCDIWLTLYIMLLNMPILN